MSWDKLCTDLMGSDRIQRKGRRCDAALNNPVTDWCCEILYQPVHNSDNKSTQFLQTDNLWLRQWIHWSRSPENYQGKDHYVVLQEWQASNASLTLNIPSTAAILSVESSSFNMKYCPFISIGNERNVMCYCLCTMSTAFAGCIYYTIYNSCN
jgi:hypothetical protein